MAERPVFGQTPPPPCVLCVVGGGRGRHCIRQTEAIPVCLDCGVEASACVQLCNAGGGWFCGDHYDQRLAEGAEADGN